MIELGSKVAKQSNLQIGDWVRTNKRFIDGFELMPFTDYLTGAEIPTRTFNINDFPDLWRFSYGWDKVKSTTDLSAVSGFGYPSPLYMSVAGQRLCFRNNDSLYTLDLGGGGNISDLATNLVTDAYTFNGMPKSANDHPNFMVIGVTDGNNNAKLMRSDTGAVWEDYLTFPTVLEDFDCSEGSNRIAAISTSSVGEVYTNTVYEVVKDAESGEFVISTLPVVGLDTTQRVAEVYLVTDNEYDYPKDYNVRHIIVRYYQTASDKPMFAIYRRATGSWENFKVPYEYSTYTNGTPIYGSYGSKYLYFGFEHSIWKIDPATLAIKEIPVISKYSRPPAADGSTEYPSENLSYNGTIVVGGNSVYGNIDDTSIVTRRLMLLICGGNSLYIYDCADDSVSIMRDKTKVGAEFKFVVGDNNSEFSWRNDGKVETFNQIPNRDFKVDAFKVNGVIDTSYRLVARKVPF